MTARKAPVVTIGFGDLADGYQVREAFVEVARANKLTQAQLIRELLNQAGLYEPKGVTK